MPQSPAGLPAALRALSDPTRLQITATLMERGETCVCELMEVCDCTPPTLSFHLNKLKEAGLITSRKAGKWIFYSPAADRLTQVREELDALLDVSRIPAHAGPGSLARMCEDGRLPADREAIKRMQPGCQGLGS